MKWLIFLALASCARDICPTNWDGEKFVEKCENK